MRIVHTRAMSATSVRVPGKSPKRKATPLPNLRRFPASTRRLMLVLRGSRPADSQQAATGRHRGVLEKIALC